mmetsp:Transcript_24442/g.21702  ORF Transcript_24442/g.21702 Transcript_24442/m.21702 type:complete len:122 (-) Transcript_24442:385-750(-)
MEEDKSLDIVTYEDLSILYKYHTDTQEYFNESYTLTLDLNNSGELEFLKSLGNKIPNGYGIIIKNAKGKHEELKMFFENAFPDKVEYLSFNGDTETVKITDFIEPLCQAIKKINRSWSIDK